MRDLDDLTPFVANSRLHSDAQIDQLAASIEQWGWTIPLLIDEAGGIIAGHGRALAAKKLKIGNVPCMVAAGWSDEQKRAYVIADNQLTLNASWDEDILRAELSALAGLNFSMDLIGFDGDVLEELLHAPVIGKTDPDVAPPAPQNPVSRLGDLWLLGNHRLRCGDSTDAAHVAALFDGIKPVLMVTDPPYGVKYDPAWRQQFGGAGVATGKVKNDDRADWQEAWDLFPGAVAYVWHGALHNAAVSDSLVRAGFDVRSQIVWVKTRAPISRGHYHWQHEPAFYAEREVVADAWQVDQESLAYIVRAGSTAGWRGGRKQTTVWFIEHLKNDTGHGTQKPVECMRRPILNNSRPGDAIYDPFCGSGTTIIAGEMEGRSVYASELDPVYVDVIVTRWQDFTGRKAVLAGSGETLDVARATRCGPAK
ncbi:site-specific DNA-methyltransferase [Seohaeicola nanhaiensis]|uniref:Methyltransferase n=1 Tax=Seohaeicola nanhaiensis TaxID=1387282 RepID=A0ABV9KEI4_9RHOB